MRLRLSAWLILSFAWMATAADEPARPSTETPPTEMPPSETPTSEPAPKGGLLDSFQPKNWLKPKARTVAPPQPEASPKKLAATVRKLLLQNLPQPLIETRSHWGEQKPIHRPLRPDKDGRLENDGVWRHLWVEAVNPAHTLKVFISEPTQVAPGRVRFTATVGLLARVHFEQQVWKRGHRLYSGSTRARLIPVLRLVCESTTKVIDTGHFFPDVSFRVRAISADLRYKDLVVEHTAGVGGELAKALGDATIKFVKEVKPSLEKDLLAKANAAIVKAADTQEVQVKLSALFEGKGGKIIERKK